MSQSVVNSSNVPLLASRAFIGLYDEVLQYGSLQIQLKADTDCEVRLHFTSDKSAVSTEVISYTTTIGTLDITRQIQGAFFYVTVRNLGVDQDYFSLSTVYKIQTLQLSSKADAVLYNDVISAGGTSDAYYNTGDYKYISVYGNASAPTDLSLQVSYDGTTFFSTQYTYSVATAGDFGYALTIPFKWIRIQSSDSVNIKIYISVA